jgi:hypothetical protein
MDADILSRLSDPTKLLAARLVEALRADERFLSFWAGGSVGRGEADRWSDLDLGAMVADADYAACCDEAYRILLAAGTPLLHWCGLSAEHVSVFSAFFDDGSQVDLCVHNARFGAVFFSYPVAMLFGEEPPPVPRPEGEPMATPARQDAIRQRAFTFWIEVLFAAKYVARGNAIMASGHLMGARGALVQVCDMSRAAPEWTPPPITFATWGRLTDEERTAIEATLTTLDPAGLARELDAVIAAADAILAPAAEAAGCADFADAMKTAVLGFIARATKEPAIAPRTAPGTRSLGDDHA